MESDPNITNIIDPIISIMRHHYLPTKRFSCFVKITLQLVMQ